MEILRFVCAVVPNLHVFPIAFGVGRFTDNSIADGHDGCAFGRRVIGPVVGFGAVQYGMKPLEVVAT